MEKTTPPEPSSIHSTSLLNIPNGLTAIRILSVPWVVYLLYGETTRWDHLWAAIVFGLALWTDYFDGLLARRMKTTTRLGRIMDPMADKLMVITGLLMLVHLHYVDVILAVLLIGRELAVNALRSLAGTEGIVISSSMKGKAKVFLEGFGIGFLMIGPGNRWLGIPWSETGIICLYIGTFLALWSAVQYFRYYYLESLSKA